MFTMRTSKRKRTTNRKLKKDGEIYGAQYILSLRKITDLDRGDYALAGYGNRRSDGVPAHDSRDHAFAKYFDC